MTHAEHDALRRELGVYVLGALDPAERDRIEEHLAECDSCRDEVASLAALPGLLTRLGSADAAAPTPPPADGVAGRIAAERRRARRRQRWMGAATAVATLVAVAAVATTWLRPAVAGDAYVAADGSVTATVEERAWGMAVQITAPRLPRRDGYVAMAVTADGHRTQVASWADTGRPVKVEGACYLAPDDVATLEILSARDDAVLTVLRPQS